MIKKIIQEVVEEMGITIDDINVLVTNIYNELKDTAKKIFFEGKATDLKDFIFDIPNDKNEEIKKQIADNLNHLVEDGNVFITKLKERVLARVEEVKGEKNIDSLLELFDFGHLKDMLKMFKF